MTAVFVTLALVAAACGGDDGDDGEGEGPTGATGGTGEVTTGGTYRIETDGIAYTSGGDPTGEYLGLVFGIFTNMLQRTLLT